MSDLLPPPERVERRVVRRDVPASGHATDGIGTLHLRVCVLPATVMALLAGATVAIVLATDPAGTVARVALAVAACVAVLVLLVAGYGARAATRSVDGRLTALRSLAAQGQEDLRMLVDRVQAGERPAPGGTDTPPAEDADLFALLAHDLRQGQHSTHQALLRVANLATGGEPDQRVEVFVNLARRMQSLVHREIQLLDDLEAQVEDPDLLKGLFTVDHLATRMRRQSESLAVLGGAVSRRQWSRPVTMQEVLRAAIAEVEHYSRVKVAPPVEGTLRGDAVADVIHLVAELVENATKFSAPHTPVLLRAQHVTAGLAIEIEDRGLGMQITDQQRMNSLLADPGRISISELLQDGRIGLFVVSVLARRHGIRVQLQTNVFGGLQAVVVLPTGLVDAGSPGGEPAQRQAPSRPGAAPAQPTQATQPTQPAPIAPPAHAVAAGPNPTTTAPPPGPSLFPAEVPTAPGSRGGDLHRSATADRDPDGPPEAAAGDPVGSGPDLPRRRPSPWPVDRDGARPPAPAATATTPVVRHEPDQPAAEPGERPRLPQRSVQAHLAPQLRDAPTSRRDESGGEHLPGLMAAFQGGVHRADEEDVPGRRTDSAP